MKKATDKSDDDLRPEYDLSKLKGGIRGKYHQQALAGMNLVLIEPDLAALFPNSQTVNAALRSLVAAKSESKKKPAASGVRRARRTA